MAPEKDPKVILITGCSSGFGLLMAARFASCGHFVFATMRDLKKQGPLLEEVKKCGSSVQILQLDVTDAASVKAAVRKVIEKAGKIDVLINNAGYGIGGFFEDLTEEDIRAQLDTNFFGLQAVTREVIPFMRRQREGKVINISSIAGLYAAPAFGAYNASKWAVEGFSESLYYELRPFGIHVSLIEPGTYPTTIFCENKRYAKNFTNPKSPYYSISCFLNKRVNDYVGGLKKDPEDIARLAEKIIRSKNPPLRNFPDLQSAVLFTMRRFLPFRVFAFILTSGLFQGFDFKSLKNNSHSSH